MTCTLFGLACQAGKTGQFILNFNYNITTYMTT